MWFRVVSFLGFMLLAGGLVTVAWGETPDMKAGLGVAMVPDYIGSEDTEGVPLVMFNAKWENGLYVNFLGDKLRANIVPKNDVGIEFGPELKYRRERADIDNKVVDRMEDVDAAVELGAFLKYTVRDISFGASFTTDVSDVYWGTEIVFDVGYRWKINEKLTCLPKVYTSYGSENFMETYFGVSEEDSVRTGLPVYDLDGGFKDYGALVVVDYQITDKWGVMGGGGVSKLIGDAKDSPLVDDLGDDTQVLAGVMATYKF